MLLFFDEARDFVRGPMSYNLNYEILSKKEFSGNFVTKNVLKDKEFGVKINQNEQEELIISNAELQSPFGHVKTYKISNDLKTFFTIAEKLTVLFDSEVPSVERHWILNKFMDTVDYKISYKEHCVHVWLALNLCPLGKRTWFNEYILMDAEFCSNQTLIKFGFAKEIPVEKHLVTSKYYIILTYNPVDDWTDKMKAVGTIYIDGEIIKINANYDYNEISGVRGLVAFLPGWRHNRLEINFNTNHYNNWNEKILIDLVLVFGMSNNSPKKLSLEYLNQNGEINTAFKFSERKYECIIFEASMSEKVITNVGYSVT